MNRMDGNINTEAGLEFFELVSRSVVTQEQMRRTVEAEEALLAQGNLANGILNALARAKSIEELIHFEMVLQTLDRRSAKSPSDKTSIDKAQRQYWQLSETVAQMRRNPDEYFRANVAFGETDGDFRKLPPGRTQHIRSNITRLRNRAAFASDEERGIWEARIKLAAKTNEMLRSMHDDLARECESRMTQEMRDMT